MLLRKSRQGSTQIGIGDLRLELERSPHKIGSRRQEKHAETQTFSLIFCHEPLTTRDCNRAHPRSVDSHRRWVYKPKTYAADRHAKSGAALRLSPHAKMADFGVRRQAVFRATPLSSKRGASEQIQTDRSTERGCASLFSYNDVNVISNVTIISRKSSRLHLHQIGG